MSITKNSLICPQKRLKVHNKLCYHKSALERHSKNGVNNVISRKDFNVMKLLEDRIRKDGIVKEGNVLKVDSFLNHQMDVTLFHEMGLEWKRLV